MSDESQRGVVIEGSAGTTKDEANLSLTLVAEFDAGPDRVWALWEDPRKLERWWGPPTFPATFTHHDFVEGGQSRYFMTGPAGEMPRGWWRIDAPDKPNRINFANGLADDDGDVEQMDTVLGMGMQEGMTLAIGQIDALLSPATV